MSFASYYRFILPENEKKLYDEILNGMTNYLDSISLSAKPASYDRINSIILSIKYDNPQLYYVDFTRISIISELLSTRINVEYYFDNNQRRILDYRIRLRVSNIAASLAKKREEEKALYIHDWLVKNCSYGNDNCLYNSAHTILGALYYGVCVCEGYAMAFKYLSDNVELYSSIVCGVGIHPDGTAGSHAWNLVNINRNNYHVDVTFDRIIAKKYFSRAYYLLSTKEILYDHQIESRFSIPDCPNNGGFLKTVHGTQELILYLESEYKNRATHSEIRLSKGFRFEELQSMIKNRLNANNSAWIYKVDSYWYGDYCKTLFVIWK